MGLTEDQFWSSTPRELAALYRAKAVIEARQRFYMATSMGAKHKSGRPLTLDDFLPKKPVSPNTAWQSQLAAARSFMAGSERLRALSGQAFSSEEKINP